MARRRKNDDALFELLLKLGGLVVLLSLISPDVRNLISAFGALLVMLLILSVLVLGGILVFKSIKRRHKNNALNVVLSKRLRKFFPQPALEQNFAPFEGKTIRLPEKLAEPDFEFLRYHREEIFQR